MVVAFILLLVAVGSVLFHIYSPWWWTPIATNWSYIDHTISITFWITGAVFFAVIAFMAYCVFRFHHKEGRQADYNPENKRLEWWLTDRDRDRRWRHVGARPVRLAPVRHGSGRCDRDRSHGPAMAMELPPPRQGRPDGHNQCPQRQRRQPDGLEPATIRMGKTTSSLQVTTCTSPSGSRSRFCSAPLDVLHDFYVPEFRAKMDMVPGMVTYFWMTPIRTGTFDVLCAELCGAAHAQMRAKVIVEEER